LTSWASSEEELFLLKSSLRRPKRLGTRSLTSSYATNGISIQNRRITKKESQKSLSKGVGVQMKICMGNMTERDYKATSKCKRVQYLLHLVLHIKHRVCGLIDSKLLSRYSCCQSTKSCVTIEPVVVRRQVKCTVVCCLIPVVTLGSLRMPQK
jgi:hypothetical protein